MIVPVAANSRVLRARLKRIATSKVCVYSKPQKKGNTHKREIEGDRMKCSTCVVAAMVVHMMLCCTDAPPGM